MSFRVPAVAVAVVMAVVMAVATIAAWPPLALAQEGDEATSPRLLVLAIPGLTWEAVSDADLVALDDLFRRSAIADLAPRSVRANARAGDAYLTIGAGTRAQGENPADGLQFEADAVYDGEPAEVVFERRTGDIAGGDVVALGWPILEAVNRRQPYDARLGLLAATLLEAGMTTAVIANADGAEEGENPFHREAALALTGPDGRLADGDVSRELLEPEPTAPYGVRLDIDRVVDAFEDAWAEAGERGGAVVVEASDLARAIRYRDLVPPDVYEDVLDAALERTDLLVAGLLESVDPGADSVLVVAPYHAPRPRGLTVAALASPAVDGAYLRSASTQRAGIVTLVDVAPTVLDAVGLPRPDGMEGRPFEVVPTAAPYEERVEELIEIDDRSLFRENLLQPTTVVLVLAFAVVVALAVMAVAGGWSRRARRAISFAALADLAALPASFLARGLPLEDLGVAGYWFALVAIALAVAGAAVAAGRRRSPLVPLGVVLAADVAVLVVDVMTGSNLHLGSAFGYSPTGNSRLYGISNYSFGQLAASACLLASLLVAWAPGRRGRTAAVALLVAVLVVLGVPVWGSDVGGVLAFTPAVLLFAALVWNVRIRPALVVAVGVLTVLAVTAFGFVDLARPPAQRAHLGRLFERVGNEGLEPLLSIAGRKFAANLRVSTSSFWVAAIPIALSLWAFLRSWRDRPLASVHARVPSLHAGLLAGTAAAVLGSLVNDSGAIVGGVAALVLGGALAHLAVSNGGGSRSVERGYTAGSWQPASVPR